MKNSLWNPLAVFLGKIIALVIVLLFIFGFCYGVIKLIKFIWFL